MLHLPIATGGDDYPPLSALNDLLFCERRAFLHRVEGLWVENVHTLSGSLKHRRAHKAGDSHESGVHTARAMRIVSHTLRVQGVADVVEFHNEVPFPIEYKRGKRRRWDNDDAQLCAQAIALEEMLDVAIPVGAIFHVKSKRRREVRFTADLRDITHRAAARLHEILASIQAPPPVPHAKCRHCSLQKVCMPDLVADPRAYREAAALLFRA